MVSKVKVCLLGLGAAALASAAVVAAKVDVTLAGKALTLDSVVVKGRTYVALDQLKAGLNAAGGASAIKATEGGVGDVLFNGVWRLTVVSVERGAGDRTWEVKVQLRNGTNQTRHIGGFGIDAGQPNSAFHLVTESGNSLACPLAEGSYLQLALSFKDLLPGASANATVKFLGPADDKPVKFIVQIQPAKGLPYVKDPSFRVDLTKTKEG